MAEISSTSFPPIYVNAYVVAQLQEFGILAGTEQMVPVFPTAPTNVEDVFKNYVGAPGIDDPLIIQYERLIRFRSSSFYPRKREQLIYYLYSTNMSKVIEAHRIITDAIDREDASGQDINLWVSENKDVFESEPNIMFYSSRAYQADETRDILELASARTIYANKLILEYDYHAVSPYYN
jgi:hypothetical protein